VRQIEAIKQEFFNAVKTGRGERLEAKPEVVLSGQIWPGSEAVKLGLIDELGTQSDALEKAANLANITNYKTEELASVLPTPQTPAPGFFATSATGAFLPYPKEPGIYMLYISPMLTVQK
jgi:ClpP class serine protease